MDIVDILNDLMKEGGTPQQIDQLHDTLRLLGVVLGQMALLDVVTDPNAKDAPKVAAARALMDLKEKPEHIAERLKAAPFAGLTLEEIQDILQEMKEGDYDLQSLINKKKLAKGRLEAK